MSVLVVYLIIAVSVALAANQGILTPVLRTLGKEEPLNIVYQYRYISHITFLSCSVLFAPIVLITMLNHALVEKFKESLLESFKRSNYDY